MSGRGARLGTGGRQVDRRVHGRQRRRHHEDDQQHQHHVDERRDVDLVQLAELVVAVVETHAMASTPPRLGAAMRRVIVRAAVEIAADQAQHLGGGVASAAPDSRAIQRENML